MSIFLTILVVLVSLIGAVHALLNKRQPRAALGWVVVCLGVPIFGPIGYLLFGINRLNVLGHAYDFSRQIHASTLKPVDFDHPLDLVTAQLSRYPCSQDNRITMLRNGEEAYPQMLEAINQASHSVYLCTYIFDSDDTGKAFVDALAACVKRGVQVRAMIDSIGSLYSFPSGVRLLRKAGVPTSRFLPWKHRNSWMLNMRNHRKLLAVDNRLAFTGGMNIGSRHLVGGQRAGSVADVQFLIEGSAARSLTDIFCRDWAFATGEVLADVSPTSNSFGNTPCRPVSDGPDSELGTLPKLLLGLISSAKDSITIITPYFLPPPAIAGALIGASLRGVRIRILLPEENNLAYVKWATEHAMGDLLRSSIEAYYQPSPFSHTKMLLIDNDFLQIGTYNMDARSLRLNFELALNIYDRDLRKEIDAELEQTLADSKRFGSQYLGRRNLPIRIRDAIAWLFTPYL